MLYYEGQIFTFVFLSTISVVIWHIFHSHNPDHIIYENLKFNKSHVASLILARGGSKGIIRKNLAKLHNTTLLGNSLETIVEFGKFNSVWVSTDNDEIAAEAKKFKANVHIRDKYTATDNAPSILGVREFVQKHPEIDIIALIQCTSPFIRKEYLERAFTLLTKGYHSVFSVSRQFKLRWKKTATVTTKDVEIVPENFSPLKRPRRQDWNGEIFENGMFYFTYSKLIKKFGLLQTGRLALVEVPYNESLEIDTPSDLIVANALTIPSCTSCINHFSEHSKARGHLSEQVRIKDNTLNGLDM